MGKTSRWFRALWGSKKSAASHPAKEKTNRGYVDGDGRSIGGIMGHYGEASSLCPYGEALDANKHAIAVAAATAAVAEAAIAAAQAAAEVVRLTSGSGSRQATATNSGDRRQELAAMRIQSAFRAYLARRALRALKGLVRLQALVRGHIVRKHSADLLQRMQAMAKIQARARANRAHTFEHSLLQSKFPQSNNHGLASSRKYDDQLHTYDSKSERSTMPKRPASKSNIKDTVDLAMPPSDSNWLQTWTEECSRTSEGDASLRDRRADDERSDKILEVDTWMPHFKSKQSTRICRTPQHVKGSDYNNQNVPAFNSRSRHSAKLPKQNPGMLSNEALSLSSLKFPLEADQAAAWTADNSPQVCSASSRPGSSSRRGPFTPQSECSRSLFSDYLGYPNYMANTESSLAKVRSQSAPRQRIQVEKLGSTKRFVHRYQDADTFSEKGSALNTNLDRLGMPVQSHEAARHGHGHGGRY